MVAVCLATFIARSGFHRSKLTETTNHDTKYRCLSFLFFLFRCQKKDSNVRWKWGFMFLVFGLAKHTINVLGGPRWGLGSGQLVDHAGPRPAFYHHSGEWAPLVCTFRLPAVILPSGEPIRFLYGLSSFAGPPTLIFLGWPCMFLIITLSSR